MSWWPHWLGVRLQMSDGCCCKFTGGNFIVNLFFQNLFVWQIFCQICLSWKTWLAGSLVICLVRQRLTHIFHASSPSGAGSTTEALYCFTVIFCTIPVWSTLKLFYRFPILIWKFDCRILLIITAARIRNDAIPFYCLLVCNTIFPTG